MVAVASETAASTPIPSTGVWYSGSLSTASKCFDILIAGKCDSTNQSRSFELVGSESIPDFFTINSAGNIVFAEPQAISIKMPRGHKGDIVVRLKVTSTEQANLSDYVCLGVRVNGELVDQLFGSKKYKISDMSDLTNVGLVPLISKTPLSTKGYTGVEIGTEVSKSGIPISGTNFNFGTVYRIIVGDDIVWLKNQTQTEGSSLHDVSDNPTWYSEGNGAGVGPVKDKGIRMLAINNVTGMLASSNDGATWDNEGCILNENETVAGTWWSGPVYNESNGVWCAISTKGIVKYSNNKIGTWLLSGKSPGVDTNSLACGNGVFMTVAKNRGVYTSTDGNTWSSSIGTVPFSTKRTVNVLCYNAGNNKWMCISSDTNVYCSNDGGKTWLHTANLSSMNGSWYGACCYANKYFYTIEGGSGAIAKSLDGIEWTKVGAMSISFLGTEVGYYNIAFYNGKLYAFNGKGLNYVVGSFD